MKKLQPGSTIKDCQFYGVKFDENAVKSVNLIAEGLLENAKALSKLADIFKASNITVDAMIRIESL